MKRVRTLLTRALVGALLLLPLGAGIASADPGLSNGSDEGWIQILLPEDPGLQFVLPEDPGLQ